MCCASPVELLQSHCSVSQKREMIVLIENYYVDQFNWNETNLFSVFFQSNVPGEAVNSILIKQVMANEIKIQALQNFMRALLIFILTQIYGKTPDAHFIMQAVFNPVKPQKPNVNQTNKTNQILQICRENIQ